MRGFSQTLLKTPHIFEVFFTTKEAVRHPPTKISENENLLQAFDQVEIAEGAMETVDVSLSIRCRLNRSDGGDAGGVDWDNLLAHSFLPRG